MLKDRAEALVFPVSSPHFAAFLLHNCSASNLTSYQVLCVCTVCHSMIILMEASRKNQHERKRQDERLENFWRMGWQGESHRQGFFSPPIILGNPGLSIRADVFCVCIHQSFIGLTSIIHWFVQITSPKQYSPVRNRHCHQQSCLNISLLPDDAFCWGFLCIFWMTLQYNPCAPCPNEAGRPK